MNNIKKIIILIMMFVVILVLVIFGYKLAYRKEIKEKKDYIIKEKGEDSKELRNKGYNLILVKNDDDRKTIPNTKLEIKQDSISRNGIILKYNTKDEVYGSNVDTRVYILERKIEDKWYSIEPIKEKAEDKRSIGSIERVLMNTYIEYFKDFSEYTKTGLPNGIYRIGFVSKVNFEKYYIMKEFEIRETNYNYDNKHGSNEGFLLNPYRYTNDEERKLQYKELKVLEGSISKKGITLIYNNDEEDKNKIYFDKMYILEKEINGIWYEVGRTLINRPLDYSSTNTSNSNNIEDDKEYKVVLNFRNLGIIDGITKGKYRLYSISDSESNKNRYLKTEFEIKE
jgi:hypothetical protein